MKIRGLTLLIVFFLVSCQWLGIHGHSPGNPLDTVPQSRGIVLMIDDYYVESIDKQYDYLQKNNIKFTYFISHYADPEFNYTRKKILRKFYTDGNEVGFHGTHHVNAARFLENHTIDEYVNYEILPALNAMRDDGYNVINFAYPYSAHRYDLDTFLLNHYFRSIKLHTYDLNLYQYPISEGYVKALDLDYKYTLPTYRILDYIDSAYVRNKIIMFVIHAFYDTSCIDCQRLPRLAVSTARFKLIFNYAISKHFHFYTLAEIQNKKLTNKILSVNPKEYHSPHYGLYEHEIH